ncbi:uncharacterized protein F4822DRAFT_394191 [Hypoxylon trugodes]|uniref:uncharacterized protein n=1 Tax=Hypoxylon trugodes TaxID=326681 RepID=UPI00218F4CDF|nr:uncharacterized protein F4822DRAFT_394191 [Hypoxylon trugodes]KAI1390697.1 hypothetical protein F4822DRAFT_394191 [Hypoxylon trugodes]
MTDDTNGVPFEEQYEILEWPPNSKFGHNPTDTVPSQPNTLLGDREGVANFLHRELSTKRLDDMYSMLFLVSKRDNVSPLHHQVVKGRRIIITERPDLHLVWYYDRIFIKPVPSYLFSYSFYKNFILGVETEHELHAAACGFLRTYASLIIHETDFNIAKQTGLLPASIDWETWCRYMKQIAHIKDTQVSRRYHYGELRLTRLNFYSKVFFFHWSYFEVHHQYVEYFARFMGPYLFIFGALTVILAAMQTALTADPNGRYQSAAYGFCTFSIALTVAGLAFFPLLYLLFQVQELFLFLFRRQKPK